jgi:hypothetical protein
MKVHTKEEEAHRDYLLEELKAKPLLETTAEDLLAMSEKDVKKFIRKSLAYENNHYIFSEVYLKLHKRFDMSGYDGGTGSATKNTFDILNIFSYLGIYDYTHYLVLDFYKGGVYLYFQDWLSKESHELELHGYTTTEIIYEIFTHTILSNKPKRRR